MSDMVELRTQLFLYRCSCGNEFKSSVYPVGDSSYGEFLLRSNENDELAYLCALDDPVFSEVSLLVKADKKVADLSDTEYSDILQNIVGIAYDADSKGSLFCIGLLPLCPACDKRGIQYYEETSPPQYLVINVPRATSNAWINFSLEKKADLVSKKLTQYLKLSN